MPTDNNHAHASLAKRLLDRMEMIARSRLIRVLRRLQPAFIIVPLVGVIIAAVSLCSPPSPPPCNKIEIQREIGFRIKQVSEVVDGRFAIESRDQSDFCARATSIYVISQLGGIAKKPPPKEDETVWIGTSGYGYRHTPSKTGSRSEEFAIFTLPELVSDYLSCTSNRRPDDEKKLLSEVEIFETITESNLDKVQSCNQKWIDDATESWRHVRSTVNTLVEIEN